MRGNATVVARVWDSMYYCISPYTLGYTIIISVHFRGYTTMLDCVSEYNQMCQSQFWESKIMLARVVVDYVTLLAQGLKDTRQSQPVNSVLKAWGALRLLRIIIKQTQVVSTCIWNPWSSHTMNWIYGTALCTIQFNRWLLTIGYFILFIIGTGSWIRPRNIS